MPLDRYRRYFAVCRAVGRSALPQRALVATMRALAPAVHPQRDQREAWLRAWSGRGLRARDLPQAWRRYLQLGAVATALLYRIGELPERLPLTVHDPDGCLALHRARGGLILPFHQHFAYHVGVLLAAQGLSIAPITLSPTLSPLAPLYEAYARSWFDDSEARLNGGKWVYTTTQDGSGAREILRRLHAGNVLYSAIDIDNIYPNSPSETVAVLGHRIAIPSRLVELACRRALPVSCCHLELDARGGAHLHVHALHGGTDVGLTISRYAARLDMLLRRDPAMWEAWGAMARA